MGQSQVGPRRLKVCLQDSNAFHPLRDRRRGLLRLTIRQARQRENPRSTRPTRHQSVPFHRLRRTSNSTTTNPINGPNTHPRAIPLRNHRQLSIEVDDRLIWNQPKSNVTHHAKRIVTARKTRFTRALQRLSRS
jgi:hypothetical protein